jgi:hypothetical protein
MNNQKEIYIFDSQYGFGKYSLTKDIIYLGLPYCSVDEERLHPLRNGHVIKANGLDILIHNISHEYIHKLLNIFIGLTPNKENFDYFVDISFNLGDNTACGVGLNE